MSSLSFAQCPADVDGSGEVGAGDLAALLGAWGTDGRGGFATDLDGSGSVDALDLSALLGAWGPCGPQVPAWATLIEPFPDPKIVADSGLRDAIVATGYAWRVRDAATGIEMVLVPPGTFEMGCSASRQSSCLAWEFPEREVMLTGAFYLGRYEVTQGQWESVVGSNPSEHQAAADAASRPVETVSWTSIEAFCTQTGLRLPTEAEWEHAYRAGTTTAFHAMPGHPHGTDDEDLVGSIAWWSGNSMQSGSSGPRPVGQKAANGFGVHDLAGNVFEWVADWYGTYPSMSEIDPLGPSFGAARVFRGGSWATSRTNLRASIRLYAPPDWTFSWVGFRVARSPG